MLFAIKYSVQGLVFVMASSFQGFQSEITVDYSDSTPFCASIEKPQLISHIITDGFLFKSLKIADGSKVDIARFIKSDKTQSFIRKNCHALAEIGTAHK